MADKEDEMRDPEAIPWGQRMYDRPFLLLIVGLLIMFGFYTIWGLIEIYSMPEGTLP